LRIPEIVSPETKKERESERERKYNIFL